MVKYLESLDINQLIIGIKDSLVDFYAFKLRCFLYHVVYTKRPFKRKTTCVSCDSYRH